MHIDKVKIESDLTVFLGENGCGKSEVLNQLSSKYANHGQNVIAIAHCIHDKFDSNLFNKKNFSFLGARSGSEMTMTALKEVLVLFSKQSEIGAILSRVFQYVGYNPSVGLSIEINVSVLDSLPTILSKSTSASMRHSNVERLIKSYGLLSHNDNLIWFDFKRRDYSDFSNVKYGELVLYEQELIRLGVINKISYYLKKGSDILNLEKASSGELSQIANTSFIASKIKANSIIFIDEPENSLHPKWQKEYIDRLLDIFSLYTPKLILATHSPLVLSSVNFNSYFPGGLSTSIFRVKKLKVTKVEYSGRDIESVLWGMFEVITPENSFLSNFLVKLMNDLSKGDITLKRALESIDHLLENATDQRQVSALQEIKNLVENLKIDK